MARRTVPEILRRKPEGRRISMLTAYDHPTAQIVDEAGIDLILVGDSLGMVVQGREDTLPVTMEEMLYHTRLVSRGARTALVVGDMPFLSYQVSVAEAVRNAGLFLKEGGGQAVKCEGGGPVVPAIRAMVEAGIPVMAHLGLTPQSVHLLGGMKVQGREEAARERILADARAVEAAGAFALVLEAVPSSLAREITSLLAIPTIGIGAGPHCDGQVLVLHDLLGLFDRFTPRFVKRYASLKTEALAAVTRYREEVEEGVFPAAEHSFD
jgi:3-methyl-2-oxobutanoate hydroxymethyltransferase